MYLEAFQRYFLDYARNIGSQLFQPGWDNYFFWFMGFNLLFFGLEVLFPWRKEQRILRKDFWLDAFYMLFNLFLFSLIGYYAVSQVLVDLFNDGLALLGVSNMAAISIAAWPVWAQLLFMFVLRDFIQWNIHRLLHRVPWLWEFHKVHHSAQEMGFAAHLRYHWMENVVYNTLQYIPLALIGYSIGDFFVVYLFTLAWGHFNHANLRVPLGPLKYIFNNPQMHIWHHAKTLPNRYGVNFGLTLSVWDYLFGTAHVPESGRDIPLGFEHVEEFPQGFAGQGIYPWVKPQAQGSPPTDQTNK
ncbi:MAG: sterol desaturase family protein [Bacteroidota bacterium]